MYSGEKQFSFTVPLSTQMYKWEPVSPASCPGKEKKLEVLEPSLAHSCWSMNRLGVLLVPLDGMLVRRRSLPRNLLGFPNNLPVPIYTSGWRDAL